MSFCSVSKNETASLVVGNNVVRVKLPCIFIDAGITLGASYVMFYLLTQSSKAVSNLLYIYNATRLYMQSCKLCSDVCLKNALVVKI